MQSLSFPSLGLQPVGLYPIVHTYTQLEQLLPLGVKIIQLRIKDEQDEILEEQIQRSVSLARNYRVMLFINDYWELAVRHRAYGVHLGQQDLEQVSIERLQATGLRLGVSAYSDLELLRACALKPSYIAYGPIFTTRSKRMFVSAQGIGKLKQVRQRVKCPLIAIGGIGVKQLPEILVCKVDGVAVISAITQAADPVQAARELMTLIARQPVTQVTKN